MSHDWLRRLTEKDAYVVPMHTFLEKAAISESQKKLWFLERVGKLWRVWALVYIEPVVVSYQDFERKEEAEAWVAEHLIDFVEGRPVSLMVQEFFREGVTSNRFVSTVQAA